MFIWILLRTGKIVEGAVVVVYHVKGMPSHFPPGEETVSILPEQCLPEAHGKHSQSHSHRTTELDVHRTRGRSPEAELWVLRDGIFHQFVVK